MIREMSVAGTFYPAREVELERYFEHFNKVYDEERELYHVKSRAIIVPHAGYIYSGYTANIAYRVLQNNNINSIVVIGPSHKVAFDGISICNADSYETPCGNIKSSNDLVQELEHNFNLKTILKPHTEHSTEVQFPFIQHYFRGIKIVELVYGKVESDYLSKIIDYILAKDDCEVIISTDLSHFHNLKEAKRVDNICLKAIENLDLNYLTHGCEACGLIGIEAMLKSANKAKLKSQILDYKTSADTSDDNDSVVGYLSACFY